VGGIIGLLVALFMMKNRITTPADSLTQPQFMSYFRSNLIAKATINLGSQTSSLMPVSGMYYRTDKEKAAKRSHAICRLAGLFHAKTA